MQTNAHNASRSNPCPTYCLVIIHTEAFEVLDEAPLEVATATSLDCCVHKPLYADREREA